MSSSFSTVLDAKLVALHSEWQSLLMTMHNFLLRATDGDVMNYDDATKSTSTCRMIDFNNQNTSLKHVDISRADMMFVIECYNLNCSIANVRRMALITDAAEICARLCIIGCRHTRKARMQPIDVASTDALLHMSASWIVQFGSIDSDVDATMELIAPLGRMALAPSTKDELHQLMAMPHNTTPQQAIADSIRRNEIDQSPLRVFALETGDPDMEDDTTEKEKFDDDEQKGNYWAIEQPVVMSRIISLASRVFHQIKLEQYVSSLYPIAMDDPYAYPPAALVNLKALVMSRCMTTAGDAFVPCFREVVHRWCLPMGTLSVQYRSTVTQFQQSSAANWMEQELGMDTSQALYNIINVPLESIASKDAHELNDMLSFFTLGTLIENRCTIDLASCTIMACDLVVKHAQLAKTIDSHEARRPIIVCLLQQVWIHDQGMLYACKSMTDALLKWLVMMKYAWKTNDAQKIPRYNNRLKGRNLTPISDDVIGVGLCTLVPTW